MFGVDFNLLVFYVQAKMVIYAHILVRHPDQSEERDQIPAPVSIEQPEAS